jgi:hypothetical protein
MGFELTTLVVIGIDCTGIRRRESNYHKITTTMTAGLVQPFFLQLLCIIFTVPSQIHFPFCTQLIVVRVLTDNLIYIYSFDTLLNTSIVLPFRST